MTEILNTEENLMVLTKIFDEVDPISISNENQLEYYNLAGFTACNYDESPTDGIIFSINKSIVELFDDTFVLTKEEEYKICQKLTENLLGHLI